MWCDRCCVWTCSPASILCPCYTCPPSSDLPFRFSSDYELYMKQQINFNHLNVGAPPPPPPLSTSQGQIRSFTESQSDRWHLVQTSRQVGGGFWYKTLHTQHPTYALLHRPPIVNCYHLISDFCFLKAVCWSSITCCSVSLIVVLSNMQHLQHEAWWNQRKKI